MHSWVGGYVYEPTYPMGLTCSCLLGVGLVHDGAEVGGEARLVLEHTLLQSR